MPEQTWLAFVIEHFVGLLCCCIMHPVLEDQSPITGNGSVEVSCSGGLNRKTVESDKWGNAAGFVWNLELWGVENSQSTQ